MIYYSKPARIQALAKNPHIAFVSGANGFIGSHLVRFLLTRGWKVRAGVRYKNAIEKLPDAVEAVVTGEITSAKNCLRR